MTHIGPLKGLPLACTLNPTAGKEQLERSRTFDEDYAVDIERTNTRLTILYAEVEGSINRLRELAAESTCYRFVDWRSEEQHSDLRLVVTSTPGQLAVVNVG